MFSRQRARPTPEGIRAGLYLEDPDLAALMDRASPEPEAGCGEEGSPEG